MRKQDKSASPSLARGVVNRHLWRLGFEPDTGSEH